MKNHIWNILSSGIYAVYATALVFITSRIMGTHIAGTLSFTIAVTDLVRVGMGYGVRNYQATDTDAEFKFRSYLIHRCLTVTFVAGILAAYLLVIQPSSVKLSAILLYCVFVTAEIISDVFEGEMQRHGQMHLAGKVRFTRVFLALVTFAIFSYVWHDLVLPLAASALISATATVCALWLCRTNFRQGWNDASVNTRQISGTIKTLFISCLPLCAITFLNIYLLNMQKYFLEGTVGDEAVGIYTLLITPTFLINLFNSFFFQGPELTKIAEFWNAGQTKRFTRRVGVQLLMLSFVFVFLFITCFFVGIPLLSFVYNVDLSEYKTQFMLMLTGGGFYAFCPVLGNTLVVMRKQGWYLAGYISAALLFSGTMFWLTSAYGLQGTAWSGIFMYPPLCLYFYFVYRKFVKQTPNINS